MGERAAQIAFERAVAAALRTPDPYAALRALGEEPGFPPALRDQLTEVDADGVRLSALLVARLRFERLMQGAREAGAWFARDPAGFTQAFRAYHGTCAPTAFSPAGEAACFEAWRRREGPAAAGECPPPGNPRTWDASGRSLRRNSEGE